MKWIAGVTLGVMVGLAVGVTTAHATFYGFLTAAKMGPMSEGFKAGYVAGAYDMLSIVVSDGDEGTMSWTSREQYYKKTLARASMRTAIQPGNSVHGRRAHGWQIARNIRIIMRRR